MADTNHDILTAIGDLKHDIGRVEGKVEGFQRAVVTHTARLNDHGGRINKLERRQSWFMGAGAAIGAMSALLFDWLKALKG